MPSVMTKDELLQNFAAAYERLMASAIAAEQRGMARQGDTWGPREIVAHLAGWEVMATVRMPAIVAGMPPMEETDPARETVMNNAINATIVTMVGDQSLAAICGMLHQAYQHNLAFMQTLEDSFFQPGEYIYERTLGVIDHCQEHSEAFA
jgi:hypothetical protein